MQCYTPCYAACYSSCFAQCYKPCLHCIMNYGMHYNMHYAMYNCIYHIMHHSMPHNNNNNNNKLICDSVQLSSSWTIIRFISQLIGMIQAVLTNEYLERTKQEVQQCTYCPIIHLNGLVEASKKAASGFWLNVVQQSSEIVKWRFVAPSCS